MALSDFVHRFLDFTGKCYRHCEGESKIRVLSEEKDRMLSVYVCSGGYVSRFIGYCSEPDLEWFKDKVRKMVEGVEVTDRDIRVATRHGWELGAEAYSLLKEMYRRGEIAFPWIREVYWFRRGVHGLFMCVGTDSIKGCGRFFINPSGGNQPLCPNCSKKA